MSNEYLTSNNELNTTSDGLVLPSKELVLSNDDLIMSIKDMVGVKCEVIGFWLWVTGATFKHKERLKELGFRWSKNKKAWYFNNDKRKISNYRSKYKNLNDVRLAWSNYSVRSEYEELNKNLEFGRLPLF